MIKDRAIVHQLRDVLRLKKGERIVFFNDKPEYIGYDFIAEIKGIETSCITFMARDKTENTREPSRKLVLYQSLIKKDNFEWVLAKATEVGVSEIIPVLSARSEKKTLNQERCDAILKEAAEQSGRALIPTLQNILTFDLAVEQARASGAKTYFASTSEKENMIRGIGERSVNLFVGPEGGWEEKEIFAAARIPTFETISLGRLTLRAETAAITASYMLLWG
jgi:16S rRNA (uracil1498-N3)-methyltransferase